MKTKAYLPVVTLSLIALVLMCGLGASAQDQVAQQPTTSAVPNLIRYGGVLKDADGAVLASQTVGITFALYKQQDGGVALWTETRNVTTDAAGQYNVMLGSTKSEGVPAELFSDQEQRWLSVQVQGQPEPTRVLLVSVPYAFKAHEAETLGGLPASAFVKAAPDAASGGSASSNNGTAVNTSSAAANGTANSIKPPGVPGPVFNFPCSTSGNPAPGYIPLFYPPLPTPANVICDSVIFQTPLGSLGNVGINTTTPLAQLEVNGNIRLTSPGLQAYQIGPDNVLSIPGTRNLFAGVGAGLGNALGTDNTFIGNSAGIANATGSTNTYTGSGAGGKGQGSSMNSFYGYMAGNANSSVQGGNSFFGYEAGMMNSLGNFNTFLGFSAGLENTNGTDNTFIGYNAGVNNSNGQNDNTFIGYDAGMNNVTGNQNVFNGSQAGMGNNGGNHNTFVGYQAGVANVAGHDNTFIGYQSGISTSGGFNNTYIGANMHPTDESNTIRIGTAGSQQTSAYIDGVFGFSSPSGVPVYINGNGKLGTSPSSRRFKEQIADMGDSSSKLFQLRPVTFFYKTQYDGGSHIPQYGLIAEEVAKVYPEMVAYDKVGQPYTVQYQLLAPMLLNELQKQHRVVAAQQVETKSQRLQIKAQQQQLQSQKQKMLAQQQQIEGLKSQLQLQNAAFQERLSRLESLVTTQLQTASDKSAPATTPATGNLP